MIIFLVKTLDDLEKVLPDFTLSDMPPHIQRVAVILWTATVILAALIGFLIARMRP